MIMSPRTDDMHFDAEEFWNCCLRASRHADANLQLRGLQEQDIWLPERLAAMPTRFATSGGRGVADIGKSVGGAL